MSVSIILVRVLLDAVERAGVDRGEILRGVGVDPAWLGETGRRFDLADFAAMESRALDLTGDDALGLHMAERVPEAAYDVIAHLVAHAPTLREAFALCVQFQRLLIDDGQVRLTEHGDEATFEFHVPRSTERVDRLLAELAVAGFMRLVLAVAGPTRPRSVSFEHPRPAHAVHVREYTRIFGDVARFGQPATTLGFDRAVLDRVHLHQHPELFALLRVQAERALAQVGSRPALVEQLRGYLLARSPSRMPGIATAARDLGISARSLRRRLAEADTSYRALLREMLEAHAGHLLRDRARSIQETASACGFANVSAFHRAFKRWTGMTPSQYRERAAQ
jgi:AraC-like DNA-binding protein